MLKAKLEVPCLTRQALENAIRCHVADLIGEEHRGAPAVFSGRFRIILIAHFQSCEWSEI
jgi:hypothetical protein